MSGGDSAFLGMRSATDRSIIPANLVSPAAGSTIDRPWLFASNVRRHSNTMCTPGEIGKDFCRDLSSSSRDLCVYKAMNSYRRLVKHHERLHRDSRILSTGSACTTAGLRRPVLAASLGMIGSGSSARPSYGELQRDSSDHIAESARYQDAKTFADSHTLDDSL